MSWAAEEAVEKLKTSGLVVRDLDAACEGQRATKHVSKTVANVWVICAIGLATCAVSECQVPNAEGHGARCQVMCARVPSAGCQVPNARVPSARCQVPCARGPSAGCQVPSAVSTKDQLTVVQISLVPVPVAVFRLHYDLFTTLDLRICRCQNFC
jgi:hypothetical protein